MKLGLYEEAKVDYDAALKSYTNSKQDGGSNSAKEKSDALYKVNYNMGINYRLMGNYALSCFHFTKATEFGFKPAAHNNLGLSNFESGKYTEAIVDFDNAIK